MYTSSRDVRRFYLLLITWASRRTVLVSSNSHLSLLKAHLISPDQCEQPVTLDDPFGIGLIIFFWSPNVVIWYWMIFRVSTGHSPNDFVRFFGSTCPWTRNVLFLPQKWVQWAPVGPSNRNRSLENWGAQFFTEPWIMGERVTKSNNTPWRLTGTRHHGGLVQIIFLSKNGWWL